jgi:hypothetical protein
MSFDVSDSEKDGQVIDLGSFRKKKEVTQELARGRNPLFISHAQGKVTGSPHFKGPQDSDFGDRLQRIRASLDKINRLMAELKKISAEQKAAADQAKS